MQPNNNYQYFHRRKLPHLQPLDTTLFITFRLHLSMPKSYFDHLKLKESELLQLFKQKPQTKENGVILKKKLFAIQDSYLDRFQSNENVLELSNCARLISEELQLHNTNLYDLLAFTVMPNHVHFLIKPLTDEKGEFHSLGTIMNLIKGRSSRYINKTLNRTGILWQREYYDHYVRNEDELNNIIRYIALNPVKAGFVEKYDLWEWTWLKEEYKYVLDLI